MGQHKNINLVKPTQKFLAVESVQIISCYHSGKLEEYYINGVSTWVRGHTSFIKAVTANEHGDRTINEEQLVVQDEKNIVDRLDPDTNAIRILEEENCKISILASNVTLTRENDGSTAANRGSIVLLIEAHGEKIMICGDATINTEYYLYNYKKYSNYIRNLKVLRVAHHGSPTSSSLAFIQSVQPQKSIVSAGKNIFTHGLPKTEIMERYQANQADKRVDPHTIYSWSEKSEYSFTATSDGKSITHDLYITGSNDTQSLKIKPGN